MQESFEIGMIAIDDWENPSKDLVPFVCIINTEKLDIIYILEEYVSSIQPLEEGQNCWFWRTFY